MGSPSLGSSQDQEAGARSILIRTYGILAILAVAVAAAAFLFAWVSPVPHQDWYGGPLGIFASTLSVARGPNGSVYVAYSASDLGGALYEMTDEGGPWASHLLDPQVTCCSSIALDSRGRVHVAYVAGIVGISPVSIKHAFWDGEAAKTEQVAASAYTYDPSLVIDAQDRVHLSFIAHQDSDSNESLMYATEEAGVWNLSRVANYTWQTLLSDAGSVDLHGDVRIAVGFTPEVGGVGILTRVGNTWQFEQVDTSADWVTWVALAADVSGHLHLAYPHLESLGSVTELRYATNAGGAWSRVDVAPTGGGRVVLSLDASGHAHVVMADGTARLAYATDVSGSWTQSIVSVSRGYDSPLSHGIAVGPEGRVCIVAVRPASGQGIEYYANVPPPVTWETYVTRASPFLVADGLGSIAAFLAVPFYLATRRAVRLRRERKVEAAVKYQEILRRF